MDKWFIITDKSPNVRWIFCEQISYMHAVIKWVALTWKGWHFIVILLTCGVIFKLCGIYMNSWFIMLCLFQQNQTKSGPDWVFICCSGIGHLCVIMSIIGLIVLHLERDRRAALAAEKEVDPADPAAADLEHAKYFLIPVVACSLILAICYLSLLCEACVSDTRAYTRTVHDVQTLQEHVETRKRVTPKVSILPVVAVCPAFWTNAGTHVMGAETYKNEMGLFFCTWNDLLCHTMPW